MRGQNLRAWAQFNRWITRWSNLEIWRIVLAILIQVACMGTSIPSSGFPLSPKKVFCVHSNVSSKGPSGFAGSTP